MPTNLIKCTVHIPKWWVVQPPVHEVVPRRVSIPYRGDQSARLWITLLPLTSHLLASSLSLPSSVSGPQSHRTSGAYPYLAKISFNSTTGQLETLTAVGIHGNDQSN